MRVENWNGKLIDWASKQIGKPFIWGETDCGTLIRQGLQVITGIDVFTPLAWWQTEQRARESWDALGGIHAGFINNFKAINIGCEYVQTGYIGILRINNLDTATIILNDKLLFSSIDAGITLRNLSNLLKDRFIFYRF